MWIVTDDETGVIVAGPAEQPPEAAAGQTLRAVPLQTRWDPARRGFVDATRWISKFEFALLWPFDVVPLVQASSDAAMARAWTLLLTWPQPQINLDDPLVLAGIARAEQLGLLTAAQAQRIRDGLPAE